MDKLIITNNSLVIKDYDNFLLVDGDFLDVLEKARDMVYKDFKLLNHPLPASIRMFFSPARSIVLGKGFSDKSCELIDQSIETYKRTIGIRRPDYNNLADYEKLDLSLLKQAIAELSQ